MDLFRMNKLLISLLLVTLCNYSFAGDLPSGERDEYIQSFHASCVVTQRTDPMSRHLSEQQREQYCECASIQSADTITLEIIGTVMRTGDRSVMTPHLNSLRRYCTEKLLPKWMPAK